MGFRRAFLDGVAAVLLLMAPVLLPAAHSDAQTPEHPAMPAPKPPAAAAVPKESTAVTIAQASSADALTATDVAVTRFSMPLTIEENSGGIAKDVRFSLTPLVHTQGTSSSLTFEPPPHVTLPKDLGPWEQVTGTLVADLPKPGQYTASMRLMFNGSVRKRYAVSITRASSAAPTVLALDIGELSDMMVPICARGVSSADLTTTLAPSGVETLTLAAPALRSLAKKTGDISLAVAGATMDLTDEKDQAVKFPVTLEPGQSQALHLRIHGFDGAGRYDAKLRFAAPGHTPIDKAVALYAREGPVVAWLSIFLGVVASFVIRLWYNVTRPKLLLERRVALLELELRAAELAAAQDPGALAVAGEVRRQIAMAWTRITLDETWNDTTSIELMRKKTALLRAWVDARAAASRAKPASIGGAVRTDLDAVETVLRTLNADEAAITAQQQVLAGVPQKLRAAAMAEMGTRVAAFSDQLDELVKYRPALKLRIESDIRPALTAVREQLDKDDFQAALASLEVARRRLATGLGQALLEGLGQPQPAGIDKATWDDLEQRLKPQLRDIDDAATADDAMRLFEAALSVYVRALAESMIRAAEVELAAQPSQARQEALTSLVSLLRGVEAKLTAGKVFEAWHDVSTAHAEFTEFYPRTRSSLGEQAEDASRPTSYVAGEAAIEGVAVSLPSGPRPARKWPDITRKLSYGDILANLAALLIASAIGLGALWKPSLVWGGWGDRLTALLWGLGVHQLSYTGLSSIFEKLK
jgi:hypothetical protein